MRKWARVAEVVKTKTLHGGLVVRSAAGLPFLLFEGMELVFVPPQFDAPRRGVVVSIREAKEDVCVLTFDSVSDIDTAEALVGCSLLACVDDLPSDFDKLEQAPYLGYQVIDEKEGLLGVVEELIEASMQSRLSVQGPYGQLQIPFVDSFVLSTDDERGVITTRIPKGLLEVASHPGDSLNGGE